MNKIFYITAVCSSLTVLTACSSSEPSKKEVKTAEVAAPHQQFAVEQKKPTPPKPKASKKPAPAKPSKVIYLTFDDGPSPYTPRVLDLLRKHKIKATFFEIGAQVKSNPSLSKRVASEGHSVQNHSYRHENLNVLYNKGQLVKNLQATNSEIKKATGRTVSCVRPPYGIAKKGVIDNINKIGLRSVMWTVDSEDWKTPGVKKIVNNVMKDVRPNGIILFHDGGGRRDQTLQAADIVINNLKKQGYSFELVCKP